MTPNPSTQDRIDSHPAYAQLAEADADDGRYYVRGVLLGEGDRTTGMSGKETVWTQETLAEAVDRGVAEGAKLIRGQRGAGHIGMDEQAAPEDIVGRITDVSYEEGRGIVYQGFVIDEGLADRIDNGLLGVSADLQRKLGDYDEELGAHTVERIGAIPRVTILDVGASRSANIETTEAEGLSYDDLGDSFPSDPEEDEEYLAASIHEPEYSGTREAGDWSRPAMSDFDSDDLGEIDDHFLGSTSGFPPENYSDLLLPVVDPDGDLALPALQAAQSRLPQTDGLSDEERNRIGGILVRLANNEFDRGWEQNAAGNVSAVPEETPDEDDDGEDEDTEDDEPEADPEAEAEAEAEADEGDDSETDESPEALSVSVDADDVEAAREMFDSVSDDLGVDIDVEAEESEAGEVSEPADDDPTERASTADEDADKDADAGGESSDENSSDTTTMADNDDTNDVEEKLAEARERIDTLESDLDDVTDERDELADEVEALESELDTAEERVEALAEQNRRAGAIIAGPLTEGSPLTPERLAEKYDVNDIIEMYQEAHDDEEGLADQSAAEESTTDDGVDEGVAFVRDQLASPRAGEASEETQPSEASANDEPSEEDKERADRLARDALGGSDIIDMNSEGLAPSEYVEREYGVDPTEQTTVEALRSEIVAAKNGGN